MQEISTNKCIVTINGKRYDLTEWQSTHPGGMVFRNGEDMTQAFIANHGKDFGRMDRFEIKDGDEKKAVPNQKTNTITEARQIIDKTDDSTDTPKPFSLEDIDKAILDDEI
jgi:hypothetical protein